MLPQAPRDAGALRHRRRPALRTGRGGAPLPCRRPRPARRRRSPETAAFVEFCLAEGLLVARRRPLALRRPRRPAARAEPALPARPPDRPLHAAVPPLLHRRRRPAPDLPLADVLRAADEFAALQGLRFIVSGGEPLLHRHFWRLNERLPAYPFRSILLTNGTMHRPRGGACPALRRGAGEPRRPRGRARPAPRARQLPPGARRAAALAEAGVAVSVATVVFAGNLERFDELEAVLRELPLKGWSIDVPCPAGALLDEPGAAPRPGARRRAHGPVVRRRLLRLQRGLGLRRAPGRGHGGRHGRQVRLLHGPAVRPAPRRARRHLARIPRWRLGELSCRCPHLVECRGGCRFRAQAHGDLLGPDPVVCRLRGV